MDRFIESLLLGLPVPGVFLVRDRDNKLLVLDGEQRLKTLQAFYGCIHNARGYKLRADAGWSETFGRPQGDHQTGPSLDARLVRSFE